MKNEFTLAFNEVLEEKQLPKEIIMEALQAAMVSAYRRTVNASNAQHVDARIDPDTGLVSIFAEKEVVEAVEDDRTEVALDIAREVDPEAQLGGIVVVETTPSNFGRVAAQTARQVIQQRIREAERDSQFSHYSNQVGEIVNGIVQAVNQQVITLGLEKKAEGIMPRNHMIPGERFRVHDRVRALLLEVKTSARGPLIILSRAHRNFLRRLLENEVPEIYHGMVEIRSIAREPGQRSKVAVAALQPGVDPVGACVGIRGVRIQAIVKELNDEKIDVIEWNTDPSIYIAKSLSPARVAGVYLNEAMRSSKTATVVVPEDQLSLAIGRDGQNARLAAKLTSWRIDIKSLPEAVTDSLYKLQNDPEYATMIEYETETMVQVETILAKKAEGRPVTPEEYHLLTQFVDRVERGIIRQRQTEKSAEEERERIARADVPAEAFEILLQDFNVSDRVYAVISEAGFLTVGDLLLQMRLEPDSILGLNGMGPKAMSELEEALNSKFPPTPEAAEIVEGEAGEAVQEMPAVEPVTETEALVEEAGIPVELEAAAGGQPSIAEAQPGAEPVMAQPAEIEAGSEAIAVEGVEGTEAPALAGEGLPGVDEEGVSLEEIFTLRPEVLDFGTVTEEEEEDEAGKKKAKGKKNKFVEVEYDPDKDVMLAKKIRKRSTGEWEEGW